VKQQKENLLRHFLKYTFPAKYTERLKKQLYRRPDLAQKNLSAISHILSRSTAYGYLQTSLKTFAVLAAERLHMILIADFT
jgi:hypothetical protein